MEQTVEATRREHTWIWILGVVVVALVIGTLVGMVLGSNQDELDAANAKISQLQVEANQAHATAQSNLARADSAEAQVEGLESQITDLQGQVSDLKKDVTHWKGKVTEQAKQGGYSVNATATFGDGTWRVGEQIQPGTYQAPGGGMCYWERLRGFSGNFGDIITNDFGSKNVTVTILTTDVGFTAEDCGTFHKIG